MALKPAVGSPLNSGNKAMPRQPKKLDLPPESVWVLRRVEDKKFLGVRGFGIEWCESPADVAVVVFRPWFQTLEFHLDLYNRFTRNSAASQRCRLHELKDGKILETPSYPARLPRKPPLEDARIFDGDLFGEKAEVGRRHGIPNRLPKDKEVAVRLRLVFLTKAIKNHAPNGAYIEDGPPLYHAESVDTHLLEDGSTGTIRVVVRDFNREQAKSQIRKFIPNAKFYR